ncbi:hypothetical protein K501DRAFT_241375 [Backusella circina FSU 941]|nr:hypothetical protein K501DRAFT_241375 [Backusella circina FSU 941]
MALITTYIPQILSTTRRFLIRIWTPLEYRWSRYTKSLLSLSLSPAEQTAFEEQFKYLIVTSPLLNDMPFQPALDFTPTPMPPKQANNAMLFRVLTVSMIHLILGLCAMTLTTTNYQKDVLLLVLSCTYLSACYFIYRHQRHLQIRRIHVSALDSMHQVISLSQKSDAILTARLDVSFRSHLVSHFETLSKFVQQLEPLTDTRNLARLRDMYNTKEIPSSLLLEKEQEEGTDLIYSVICWKRREYLIHLLDVMTSKKEYNRARAIKINSILVQEYQTLNKTLNRISSSLGDVIPTSPDVTSDTRSSASLINRLLAVEKHLEDIQVSLFLCKQDMKSLSSGRGTMHSLERMNRRFDTLDKTIPYLLNQWKESKTALQVMLQQDTSISGGLPSPPSSPLNTRFSEDDTRTRRHLHRLSLIQT